MSYFIQNGGSKMAAMQILAFSRSSSYLGRILDLFTSEISCVTYMTRVVPINPTGASVLGRVEFGVEHLKYLSLL